MLEEIQAKYKDHESYDEMQIDVENALDRPDFYNCKRIGYFLIEIFNDKVLSRKIFDKALELCESDEDIKDVICDITFLSEDWADELQRKYEVDINEDD
jgi:hypothetical protein